MSAPETLDLSASTDKKYSSFIESASMPRPNAKAGSPAQRSPRWATLIGGALICAGLFGVPYAGSPPSVDLPTDILVPYVPAGWKLSTLKAGNGHTELGEFTPTGDATDKFTDLVGYTVNPIPPGRIINSNIDMGVAIKAGLAAKCTTSSLRELKSPAAKPGWRFYQSFCVLKDGPAAGLIDVNFQAFLLRPTALFSVWRAWRGPNDDFDRFLAATTHKPLKGMINEAGAAHFDDDSVDRATDLILSAWSNTFDKVEVCDLSLGEICPSYRVKPSAPMPPNVIAFLNVEGSHELTPTQVLDLQAKMPGALGEFAKGLLSRMNHQAKPVKGISFGQSISLADHDWTNGNSAMAALMPILLGAKANGGSLAAIDEQPLAPKDVHARMQAYVVFESHILWRLGIRPDRQTLTLAPSP